MLKYNKPLSDVSDYTLLEPLFQILNDPVYQGHRSTLFKNVNIVAQVEQNRAN